MFLDDGIFDIAYSTVGLRPINTAEHYRFAAACGYPALKGDVRPTKDGGLVMCHDAGFTIGEDGRIGRFDRENNTPILTLGYEECRKMEYDAMRGALPQPATVATLDDFLGICRETGKYAFITVRDQEIPAVVAEMMRLIRLHGMEERCVVNSFTYETIAETRKYSDVIPVSHVQGHWRVLTDETVKKAAALGNAIVCMFSFPDKEGKGMEAVRASLPAIETAKAEGVRLFQAILTEQKEREECLKLGFTGFQLERVFPPFSVPETV